MASVFISRAQHAKSPFTLLLQKAGYEVTGKSLIVFEPIIFDNVPQSDWIFFSSKNGVRYFFQQVSEISPATSLACIGTGTADALKAQGFSCTFVGTGAPESTASGFGKIAAGKKVLFPQARQSRKSIQSLLGNKVTAINLPVYDNKVRTGFQLPYCDVLTFTSPLNVEAYCQQYTFHADQQIVSIGETTAKALKKYTAQPVHIAPAPSERSMAKLIISLAQ
jgi:hydroxymethylbilane synthase